MTALLENSIHTTYHYALTLRTLKIGNVYKECNGEGERKLTLVSVSPTTRSIQCADSLYNPCTFTYNAQRRSWISDSDATAHLEVRTRTPNLERTPLILTLCAGACVDGRLLLQRSSGYPFYDTGKRSTRSISHLRSTQAT
jgi:hypothetical protein